MSATSWVERPLPSRASTSVSRADSPCTRANRSVRSAGVLGSIETAMSRPSGLRRAGPIRSAFTVTQRLPPRWTRAHGSPTGTPCSTATSAAATLYAAAGIGVIGSSGGFSRSRAAAAPAVWVRTWRSGSSTTTAGPTGSSWSGVSTKVRASADRSPGTTYGASEPR